MAGGVVIKSYQRIGKEGGALAPSTRAILLGDGLDYEDAPDVVLSGTTGGDGEITGATRIFVVGGGGGSAYTTTTADYTQPETNGDVTISVDANQWVAPGETIFIATGGYYLVVSTGESTITIEYLGYGGSTASGDLVSTGSLVTPSGPKGEQGDPGFPTGVCGDGSDGTVVYAGGTTTTLTRSVYGRSITFEATSTVNLGPRCKFFATAGIVVEAGATINANGDGGVGASGGLGSGGGVGGTNGGAGSTVGGGTNGTGSYLSESGQSRGGAGGLGTAGAGFAPADAGFPSPHDLTMALVFTDRAIGFYGGSGGGGGGGDGVNSGGGGGGGGGNAVFIAPEIIFDGDIFASGGRGANASAGNCGGGGGGGGGHVYFITRTLSGAGNASIDGGAGGTKTGTGVNGSAGAFGSVIQIPL